MAKILKIGDFNVLESENELTWNEAVAFAETASADGAGSFSDWVLPDLDTLKALKLQWDTEKDDNWFWSSTTYVGNSRCAWAVRCDSSFSCYGGKFNQYRVLLVRTSQLESMRQAGRKND